MSFFASSARAMKLRCASLFSAVEQTHVHDLPRETSSQHHAGAPGGIAPLRPACQDDGTDDGHLRDRIRGPLTPSG